MSEHSQQIIRQILGELRKTRRRLATARTLTGTLLVISGVAIVWTLAAAAESGFWLSSSVRFAVLWGVVVVAAVALLLLVVYPALQYFEIVRGPTDEDLARVIGNRFSPIADRLLSLLSLSKGHHSPTNPAILDGAIQSLANGIDTSTFTSVEDFSAVKKTSRIAVAALFGSTLLFILAPTTFLGASQRLLSPAKQFDRPLPFSFTVEPGSVEVVRGSSLNILVRVNGDETPKPVGFEFVNEGENVTRRVEAVVDGERYKHALVNVRQNFRYRAVVSGGYSSAWYHVQVYERPVVRKLSVELVPPSYSRTPRVTLDANVGNVHGLRGTRVNIEASVSGPEVESATIVFDNGVETDLTVSDDELSGAFIITRSGTYHLSVTTQDGIDNSDPIEYEIEAREDESPSILLVAPDDHTPLTEANQVYFAGRVIDDYGFWRLALNYRVSESRFGETMSTFEAVELSLSSSTQRDQPFEHAWALGEHSLSPVPGDEIEVFVEVWDNDSFAGAKSARSAVITLRYPSLSEQYEALDQNQDRANDDLNEIMEDAEAVRNKFDELRDELRQNPESDWENNRQMEQLLDQQESIEERVDEFTSEIDELIQQMEDNGLVSQETLEMYEELKKVSDEINSPELMEALQELQEAMKQMSLEAMQEAVEKFEFSEDQYQKRLERTLDLFKKFKTQQSLDEVQRRAEELEKVEKSLEEKTRNVDEALEQQQSSEAPSADSLKNQAADDLNRLAEEQERAREEMESLLDRMQEIQDEMQDVKGAPQQEMEQMNESLQQQQLPQQMQENAEQLREQQTQPAMQGQQQMQQQFNQMQQNLSQMQQNMTGSQMSINMQGLRQALDDVLVLSREQEDVRSAVDNLVGDSHMLRGFAQQQLEISEGLSTVSDSLQKLSREIPQMSREVQAQTGEALREMGSAINAMSDRVARRATGHQKSAMMHLNELAVLLSDLLSQLMNQQSGMGGGQSMEQMIQQMQQMAGQQQQLNQQLQEMLNDAQGQRLTGDVQARLNQLAQQQEELRKQLKQMSRNPDLRGKLLGDLNKIAEQMLEAVEDLQRRRMSRNVMERQQQILTRMLESTKSMQERGREERRESQTAEEIERISPESLEKIESADQLRRDLIRALEAGYSPDYEALIKRYFKLLEESGS